MARPSASRRVLSSWQQQGAPAINVYESAEPPARLWQHYLADLTVQGWQVSRANAEAPSARHAQMLLRDGHQLVLSVETHKAGTLIAVMQLDAGPGVARVR